MLDGRDGFVGRCEGFEPRQRGKLWRPDPVRARIVGDAPSRAPVSRMWRRAVAPAASSVGLIADKGDAMHLSAGGCPQGVPPSQLIDVDQPCPHPLHDFPGLQFIVIAHRDIPEERASAGFSRSVGMTKEPCRRPILFDLDFEVGSETRRERCDGARHGCRRCMMGDNHRLAGPRG